MRFLADCSATSSIEYGLIASGIAIAIVGVVQGLGSSVIGMYNTVGAALK